jgi:hypothetical protein
MNKNPQALFDEDYYLNGLATHKSNYENYHWMPETTTNMAHYLIRHLGIRQNDSILDFGCARGYIVKAMRNLKIQAFGYDVSEWAINNCDEEVKQFVSNTFMNVRYAYDFILAKDVFEHIPEIELSKIIPQLLKWVQNSLFITVPLTSFRDGPYVCPRDEMDATHVIRWTVVDWMNFLIQLAPKNFIVSVSTRIPVIKPMCEVYPMSYGFFRVYKYE